MAQSILPRSPNVKIRILLIGRANAGKTTIMQRVTDTTGTEGLEIYRRDESGKRELIQRGNLWEYYGDSNIEDELVFTNHDGYVFHKFHGLEPSDEDEIGLVREFVRKKSLERQLEDRLHMIWYCIPMDNDWPEPDLNYLDVICTISDVPVIAVFTKYDQFKRTIQFRLEDTMFTNRRNRSHALIGAEAERIIHEDYLDCLSGSPPFVRLENMHKPSPRCTELLEITAKCLNALNDGVLPGPRPQAQAPKQQGRMNTTSATRTASREGSNPTLIDFVRKSYQYLARVLGRRAPPPLPMHVPDPHRPHDQENGNSQVGDSSG